MIIHNVEQNSPEWLQLRKTKIGASDASAIMQVSPWSTPFRLWFEKTYDVQKKENPSMSFGKANEESARILYQQMTGNFVAPLVASHGKREWQLASFDGMDIDFSMFVEIKCANKDDHATAKSGTVPSKYYPQVQHQLAVAELDMMHYFSFHKGEGVVVEVHRDDAYIKKLIKAEEKFYFDHLVAKKAPKMTDKDGIEMDDEVWNQISFVYQESLKELDQIKLKVNDLERQLLTLADNKNCHGNGVFVARFSEDDPWKIDVA